MRFAFIASVEEENRRVPRADRISIRLVCQVLKVSPSGYYAWKNRAPSCHQRADDELSRAIAACHVEHDGRAGIVRTTAQLARAGRRHSPKRVRRLTRAMGLECVHPKPRAKTTMPGDNPDGGLIDLVNRDFTADSANQVWYGDITYIRCGTGDAGKPRFVYLATVIDAYSRMVVGWQIADHMRTELVADALKSAINNRNPHVGQAVFHADRGGQYTSRRFRNLCLANGILPSVGRTGSCYDNAAAESFNALIKKELIHLTEWRNTTHVRQAVFNYIERYYNRSRIQHRLGWLSPTEYELQATQPYTVAA